MLPYQFFIFFHLQQSYSVKYVRIFQLKFSLKMYIYIYMIYNVHI